MKRRLFFIGDIHYEFSSLCEIINSNNITNSYIIQVGDFGVGFSSFEKDLKALTICNDVLKERDVNLYVIRGNHDNPLYFYEDKFHLSNIFFVQDYTVLDISNHKILCLGGAITVDRFTRKEDISLWANEKFIFDEKRLNDVRNIDIIVSHSAPIYCFPDHMAGTDEYFKNPIDEDTKLLKVEVDEERKKLEKAVSILKKNNNINYFVYGHFHQSKKQMIDGTNFILLNIKELYEI